MEGRISYEDTLNNGGTQEERQQTQRQKANHTTRIRYPENSNQTKRKPVTYWT